MKNSNRAIVEHILGEARHSLQAHHLPRIARCLGMLSEEEIWWRPHPTSNSVGNLVLHLEGNVRQWLLSGLGGRPDLRDRDWEFRERGPISRRTLLARLRKTVGQACRILSNLSHTDLARAHRIQGFRVTSFKALSHVTEHFVYHTGQIVFVTKLKQQRDLSFTRLPGEKLRRPVANLPPL